MASDTILAAGLYDASDNLVASWETLVTEYGMDIKADQLSEVSSYAPANVLAKNELSAGAKLVISDSVTRIGANAFAMLDTLVSVVIPNSVTSIGYGAFNSCYNLVSVNIPVGITTIGHTTFFECKKMTSINIPAGVTSIEYRAFCFCDALTDVYYGGAAEQWQAISISADNTKLTSATIHYTEEPEEEPEEETLLTATVSYKGETLTTLAGGEYVNLHIKGTEMEDDIRIEVAGRAAADPILQEKAITENGEYTADSGYDGLSKVTVNVPGEVVEEYDGTVLFLISFTIDGTEYQAEEGMTWEEWCISEYNTIGVGIDGGYHIEDSSGMALYVSSPDYTGFPLPYDEITDTFEQYGGYSWTKDPCDNVDWID